MFCGTSCANYDVLVKLGDFALGIQKVAKILSWMSIR